MNENDWDCCFCYVLTSYNKMLRSATFPSRASSFVPPTAEYKIVRIKSSDSIEKNEIELYSAIPVATCRLNVLNLNNSIWGMAENNELEILDKRHIQAHTSKIACVPHDVTSSLKFASHQSFFPSCSILCYLP